MDSTLTKIRVPDVNVCIQKISKKNSDDVGANFSYEADSPYDERCCNRSSYTVNHHEDSAKSVNSGPGMPHVRQNE